MGLKLGVVFLVAVAAFGQKVNPVPAPGGPPSGNAGTAVIGTYPSSLTLRDFVSLADYSPSATINTALTNAVTAACSAKKDLKIPGGTTYVIDNSGGQFVLPTCTTGLRIYGDGATAAKITCNTLANTCLTNGSGSSNLEFENLDLSFSPATTTRNTFAPLLFLNGVTGAQLNSLNLHNGNNSGIIIQNSTGIKEHQISCTGLLANCNTLYSSSDAQISDISSSGDGDATVEISYVTAVGGTCQNITISGLVSIGDENVFINNGCQHVSLTGGQAVNTVLDPIDIDEDGTVNTSSYPDDTEISNFNIVNPGRYGVNVYVTSAPSSPLRIKFNNVHIEGYGTGGSTDYGFYLQDGATMFDVQMDNVSVYGSSASLADAFRLSGHDIQAINLYCKYAGLHCFTLNRFNSITGANWNSVDPNQNAANDGNAFSALNYSVGFVNIDGLNFFDDRGSESSNFSDASTTARRNYGKIIPFFSSGTQSYTNNSNTILEYMTSGGQWYNTNAVNANGFIGVNPSNGYQTLGATYNSFQLPMAGSLLFSSSAYYYGTPDTGIARSSAGVIQLNNGTAGSGGALQIPAIKATTGTRYVCVDTSGNITSSATACSGT